MMTFIRRAGLLLLAGLSACAAYQPKPLDPDAHRAAWALRDPALPSVADFARRAAGDDAAQKGPFDAADGLTVSEAELVALFFNPALHAARARAGVARASAKYAGLWHDPEIGFDLLRVIEAAPDPWVAALSMMIELPLSGRRWLEKQRAQAEVTLAQRRVLAEEWELIQKLGRTWIEWSALREKAEIARAQLTAIEPIRTVAETLSRADEIRRADARLFAIQAASVGAELHHFTHEAEEKELELKGLLGLRPETPVEFLPAFPADGTVPSLEEAEQRLREFHPALRVLEAEYAAAEKRVGLEDALLVPDLKIGPAVESDEGVERAGGNLSLTVPLWNRNRRAIAEAEAAREAANAAYLAEIEARTGELSKAIHEFEAAQVDLKMLTEDLAPLVDEQVKETRELAELGDLDALLLLDSLTRAYETKQRIIEARSEVALARARIDGLAPVGPTPTGIPEDDKNETP